jgi:hypothetical protein
MMMYYMFHIIVLSIDMLDSYINGRTDMMANHIYMNSDHYGYIVIYPIVCQTVF